MSFRDVAELSFFLVPPGITCCALSFYFFEDVCFLFPKLGLPEGFLLPLLVISFGFQDFNARRQVPKPRYLSPDCITVDPTISMPVARYLSPGS